MKKLVAGIILLPMLPFIAVGQVFYWALKQWREAPHDR